MLQMNGLQSDSGTHMLYLSLIGLPKFTIREHFTEKKKSRFLVSLEKLEDLAARHLHAYPVATIGWSYLAASLFNQ